MTATFSNRAGLARRLGLFDATMIVMGGIIGSGIFINGYVVARQVHTPVLIVGAWAAGGAVALAGAFIYAELAAARPLVGGQYAYLREAYHPAVAFMYGWALLLVIQTGGMAAVAVTFSRYFLEIVKLPVPEWLVSASALLILSAINCLGVRAGAGVQSALMILKIVSIAGLIICGLVFTSGKHFTVSTVLYQPAGAPLIVAMGAAMVPVMFSYGGWQTAGFIAGELKKPGTDLPLALLIGVSGVILLYVLVNLVTVAVLGPARLAGTVTPASAVMRAALGNRGAMIIATGIAISTIGFLGQGMLTAPRVYFAMADDGLFFKSVAWVHPLTRVPVVAIALQGVFAAVIAISGKYEQILNYVVSIDFIWFGLTATCVFVFRKRDRNERLSPSQPDFDAVADVSGAPDKTGSRRAFRVPGHPATTIFFMVACWSVVAGTFYRYPENSLLGLCLVLAGIPVYYFWSMKRTGRHH